MTMGDEWVVSIKRRLATPYNFRSVSSPCIFRASPPLRNVNPQSFTPQTVAIGPYHRRSLHEENEALFDEMETYKIMAAQAVQDFMSGANFNLFIKIILKEERQLRTLYDKDIEIEKLGSEAFSYMLGLDAAFIIAVLHSFYNESPQASGGTIKASLLRIESEKLPSHFEPIYARKFSRPVRKSIIQDLLLLENQIPLVLLKKLIRMDIRCKSDEEAEDRLESYISAAAFATLPFTKSIESIAEGVKGVGEAKAQHLLDCIYDIVTWEAEEGEESEAGGGGEVEVRPVEVPSATQLYKAGVKLEGHDESLMKISFEHRTLSIPRIYVGDETERMFRNLVAYEGHMEEKVEVVSYLHFMNYLIDTPEDVTLLVERGIMTETIGSNKDVARMWNRLCHNTVSVLSPRYNAVAVGLRKHCDSTLHGLVAEFKRRYLSRPWLALSLISGIALLLMTFITTWYTVGIYKHGG